MSSQTVIGSGSTNNDGGKILGGGANVSGRWGVLSIVNSIDANRATATPLSSSWTEKVFSGGAYGTMTAGKYVARLVNTELAGDTTKNIRLPASDFYRTPYNKFISYNRLHITSWNHLTGAATKGGNAGDAVYLKSITPSSANLTTGEAFPTRAVPGELVYRTGAPAPVQNDYQPIVD